MTITSRAFRGPERYATFTPDGNRLLVAARYIYALEVPSLQVMYRVRPLPGMGALVMQLNGEHMLVPYTGGQFALMAVENGEVIATCGDRSHVELRQYALSLCGAYMLQIRSQKDIQVREIRSNQVVWQRKGDYGHAAPMGETGEWAVFAQHSIEVWRWPFGDQPERMIPLDARAFWPHIQGTMAAIDAYEHMPIIDLTDGHTCFVVKGTSLTRPYIRRDGSVIVAQRDEILRYSSIGQLAGKIRVPAISLYGHAFSPVRDDAALSFNDGLVFIREFNELIDSGDGLNPAWPAIEQKGPASFTDYMYRPKAPIEQTRLEARTPQELQAAISGFLSLAWKPVLKAEISNPKSSKFGGVPWLARDEEWPRCGQCGGCMDLFLQLNSVDLPRDCPKLFDGLLQVFLCSTETYSGGLCQSSHAFSDAGLVRVVQADGPSSATALADEELFEEMHIIDWSRQEDYPGADELSLLGVELDEDQQELRYEGEYRFPLDGDKLLGWAAWQQGVERVRCPECSGPMREIFQIESCEAIPLMFGDGGRGWVSQCPAHPKVVCFSWTCG